MYSKSETYILCRFYIHSRG